MERESGLLETGGERIYHESMGAGDPVVFCHGLGGNHAIWWHQLLPFAERYRVVTWDQRGFGNSSRATGEYGPGPAVDDLRALLDHLGIERTHLVGQSMGGWVVMGFAIRHPDRVRSLVLADTLAGLVTPDVTPPTPEQAMRGLDADPRTHPALGAATPPEAALLYNLLSDFGDKAPVADMLGRIVATRWPVEQARGLGLPALCLVGEQDQLCPPAAMRSLADLVGAELVEIAGAGHSPYFERPSAWNDAVLTFLARA